MRSGCLDRGTATPVSLGSVSAGILLAGSLFVLASGIASAAAAAEFSLRIERRPEALTAIGVTLAIPCSSWSCGVGLLEGRWRQDGYGSLRFELPVSSEGIVRGRSGNDHDALWVIVEPDDSPPLALLWRPPAASGDLPPLTLAPKSSCLIEVTNEQGEPVAGATVAPAFIQRPSELRTSAGEFSTVFAGWIPWLPPQRTDAKGRSELETPAGGAVTLAVRADGHLSATAECRPDTVVRLRLERSTTRRFRVESGPSRALVAALARDRLGMPLALSDADGRIDLDARELGAALASRSPAGSQNVEPPWFEMADGRIYAVWRRSGDVLTVRELTSSRSGAVRFGNTGEPDSPAAPETILAWREPVWPWPAQDSRAAAPLLRVTRDYAIPALPDDRLWFVARGFGHAVCPAAAASDRIVDESACPVLKPAPTIEGVVVDESGLPLSHAEIRVSWPVPPGSAKATIVPARRPREASALMRSDQNGRFDGRHVPLVATRFGSAREVRVDRPPYLPIRGDRLDRHATEGAGFRIELAAGTLVVGRVVDAATGLPVTNAEVGLGRFSRRGRSTVLGPLQVGTGAYGKQVRVTRTDGAGIFRLNTWPGRHDLAVRASGHASLLRNNLEVPAGGLDAGDIHVAKELEIRGIVEDTSGAPVSDAAVWAAGAAAAGSLDEQTTDAGPRSGLAVRLEADRHGRFRVAGLAEGSRIDIEVSSPRYATQQLLGLEPIAGTPVTVTLEAEAVVAGRVTRRGRGVPARLELLNSAGDSYLLSTDGAGRFRTSGLAPGRYDVLALPHGSQTVTREPTVRLPERTLTRTSQHVNPASAPTEAARASVEALAGETVDLELELEDGKRRLVGTVVEFGVGVPGVEIRTGGRRTMTDGSGVYSISGLGSGLVGVTAERKSATVNSRDGKDRQEKLVELVSEATRLDFDFSMYAVSGHAVWADNAPAAAVEILFSRVEDGIPFAVPVTTHGDGYFELDLLPGVYRARTRVDGTIVHVRDLLRVRNDASAVRLRFRRNLRIHGVVTGLTREQLDTLQVEALNREMGVRRAEHPSAPSEGFSIEGLDSGAWTVVGRLGNSTRLALRQVQLDDQDVRIELEFRPLPALEGRVLLDGQPFQGMTVFLGTTRELVSARRVWTGHDGAYRFPDVEPGQYVLTAGASSRTISLAHDMELPLEFASGRMDGWTAPHAGRSRAGAQVRVWPSAATLQEAEILGLVRSGRIADDGRFGFGSLPEGVWMLDVEGTPGQRRVAVPAGSAVQVQLPESRNGSRATHGTHPRQ